MLSGVGLIVRENGDYASAVMSPLKSFLDRQNIMIDSYQFCFKKFNLILQPHFFSAFLPDLEFMWTFLLTCHNMLELRRGGLSRFHSLMFLALIQLD